MRHKGFKAPLEILLSGTALVTREVPFRFAKRHRIQGRWRRLAGFAAVGALAVAVNTGVLTLLTRANG